MARPSVLFVCQGNIMRSPMAEAFYNHLTGEKSLSAGVAPGSEYNGLVDPRVVAVMQEIGIDLSESRTTKVSPELIEKFDKIIFFPTPLAPDYITENPKTEFWNVADPWYLNPTPELLRQTRDQILQYVRQLIG